MASCVAIVGGVARPRSSHRPALSVAMPRTASSVLGEQPADLRQAFLVDGQRDPADMSLRAVEPALAAGQRRLLDDL